jgi:oligopeptidase B
MITKSVTLNAGYSPYDNVPKGKAFPPIIATAGLNDPRVGYWEPLKWALKVRENDANGGVNVLYRYGQS